jgi:hypothetical protein
MKLETGADLTIPIHPNLRAALKAGPAYIKHLLTNLHGLPFTSGPLKDMLKRAAKRRGCRTIVFLTDRLKPIRPVAVSGCVAKAIAAASGHKPPKEIERYAAAGRSMFVIAQSDR